MLKDNANQFRIRLEKLGLSESAISAAWPSWWSDEADASPSARAELRYSLARKLGLEPHSLLDDEATPGFLWTSSARFKNLSGESDLEMWAITSFGTALGRILFQAATPSSDAELPAAETLRTSILTKQPYVRLLDLIALAWSFGIPTIHLRIFPLIQKRMAAMSVRLGNRKAILLAKDAVYPPQIAFYLAHELAHIHYHHVAEDGVLVDYEAGNSGRGDDDREETDADRYALEILTGHPDPEIIPVGHGRGARSLARAALDAASSVGVEAGVIAVCYGFSTREWATAMGALRYIYGPPRPVWQEINGIALRQLEWSQLSLDSAVYIRNVLGAVE